MQFSTLPPSTTPTPTSTTTTFPLQFKSKCATLGAQSNNNNNTTRNEDDDDTKVELSSFASFFYVFPSLFTLPLSLPLLSLCLCPYSHFTILSISPWLLARANVFAFPFAFEPCFFSLFANVARFMHFVATLMTLWPVANPSPTSLLYTPRNSQFS